MGLIMIVPVLVLVLLILLVVFILARFCYRRAFYSANEPLTEEYPIPEGQVYEPHRDVMVAWMKEVRAMEYEEVSITSFDGLTLRGKIYRCNSNGALELMFHGYRGNSERDLCGGVQRAFALGHNVLMVDQRGCGSSDGHVITFGINESRDCLDWTHFAIRHFGPDVKIILTGISMGAATVVITAGQTLPKQVIGVLADCGFTTAREMIQKTIREMKLPAGPAWPFVKLGAKWFGHFNLEETTALEAVKHCTVPAIFFHGEADDFVPCDMSRRLFRECPTRKALVTVPGAGHGLSYLIQPERYIQALGDFFGPLEQA